jgi:hypothetical protein
MPLIAFLRVATTLLNEALRCKRRTSGTRNALLPRREERPKKARLPAAAATGGALCAIGPRSQERSDGLPANERAVAH